MKNTYKYLGKDECAFKILEDSNVLLNVNAGNTIINDIGDQHINLVNCIISPLIPGLLSDRNWIFDYINYAPKDWDKATWIQRSDLSFDCRKYELHVNEELINKSKLIKGNFFYIDDFVSNANFGHFVHDLLPAAKLFFELSKKITKLTPVFRKKFKYKNQIDLFENMFISLEQCLYVDQAVILENIYVPRRQQNFGSGNFDNNYYPNVDFNIKGIKFAQRKIAEIFQADFNNKYKKIYLYRKNNYSEQHSVSGRNFNNLHILDEFLLSEGFLVVDPSFLDCKSLSSLLSYAEIVVSIHGAGLANIIFSRSSTNILEIRPSTGSWRSLEFTSRALGQNFNSVSTKNNFDGQKFDDEVLSNIKTIINNS
jgi:hypothetical protein